ncbi:hypothetical protein SAMN05518849_11393 [Sphingobium sp. AP50]|nr:hypothetical protein SAMN05518849_11393 [Sphingobium sp. AP50]
MVALTLLRKRWPKTALILATAIAAAPFLLLLMSLFLDI